jgi:hypothetical protein
MPNGSWSFRTVKTGTITVFKASLYDINNAIEAKDLIEHPLEEIVPEHYHTFLPLFHMLLADRFPLYGPEIDHEVRLKEGETPTWGPLYSISRNELVVLKEWLEENISKGFIRQSWSIFAAPALFPIKLGGGLWICIDYTDINSQTIINRYPLPWTQETLNLLGKNRVYTKVDFRGLYNVLRVKVRDEHKFAFWTRY